MLKTDRPAGLEDGRRRQKAAVTILLPRAPASILRGLHCAM